MTTLNVEKDEQVDVLSILRTNLSNSNSSSSPIQYYDSNSNPTSSSSQDRSLIYVRLDPHPKLIPLESVTRLASSTSTLTNHLKESRDNKLKLTIPPFLSLRTILFAKEKENEPLGNYFRECTKQGFPRLEALERNDVLSWLNGKRDSWNGVLDLEKIRWKDEQEQEDQANLPASQSQLISKSQEETQAISSTSQPTSSTTIIKRNYVPDEKDQAFVKKLRLEKELIIRNHNDVLHGSIINSSSTTTPTATTTTDSNSNPTMISDSNNSDFLIKGGLSGINDFSSIRKSLYPKLETLRKSTFNKMNHSNTSSTSTKFSSSNSSRPTASSLNDPSTNSLNPSSSSSSNANNKRNRRPLDPILLLSNSPTSLINMFNVKKFLEEGIFIEPDLARKQAGGISEPVVSVIRTWGSTISSKSGGNNNNNNMSSNGGIKPLRFIVVDNNEMLQKLGAASAAQIGSGANRGEADVWNRVCVVFTTGQDWQFRNYKWNDGKELFKNVMGIYVRWNNDDKNPAVRDWNVTELQVERSKRHTDKQLVAHFWRTVESWISRRKPQFAP